MPPWRKLSRRPPRRLINRESPWPVPLIAPRMLLIRVKKLFRARLSKSSRNNKKPSSKHSFTNWTSRRSRDRLRSSKMRISRERLLRPREKDNKRKCFQEPELPSSKSSKKKRLLRSLRLREWSKSSLPLRLFKRPRPPLLRRLLPRLTLPDLRESMSSLEERLRLNSRCSKSSSRWRPSKLSNSKNRDSLRTKPTLRSKNNSQKSSKLKPMCRLSRMLPLKLRRRLPRRRPLRRRDLLSRKPLRRRPRSSNKSRRQRPRRELRSSELPRKRRRRLNKLNSFKNSSLRLKNKRNNRN